MTDDAPKDRCIRATDPVNFSCNTSWCGRNDLEGEWAFTNAAHAANTGRRRIVLGRPYIRACRKCVQALIDALRNVEGDE